LTNAIEEEHTNFAAAINHQQPPLVTFEDGRRALSIAQEIINQLEEKTS
jgi:predicted dehydrogenase